MWGTLHLALIEKQIPNYLLGCVETANIKDRVIQMIQNLPDDVSVEDIMAELYFRLRVDAGLKELDEGKGIPHKEVEKWMSKWLNKKEV